MINFGKLRDDVCKGHMKVDELYKFNKDFLDYSIKIMNGKNYKEIELGDFLILCLDFYAFSEAGTVLIPDRNYDMCMKEYVKNGYNMIIFPDDLLGVNQWSFMKHEVPGLVGSLDKIYTYEELKDFFNRNRGVNSFILAPKYDGISVCVKVKNGGIVYALTRYDGEVGQDITSVIRRARNVHKVFPKDGYYKCEVCVSTEDFDDMTRDIDARIINTRSAPYMNRRSATSGIINSPKNVNMGRYLTLVPLMYYNKDNDEHIYIPPEAEMKDYYTARDLMSDIEDKMHIFKNKDFPLRVDGIVIFPVRAVPSYNEKDFMEDAIAYKINTSEAVTTVECGYMSVGRLGNAIPMLHVDPVEVNETIVSEVSLGSYDKFLSMNLCEGEEVIVYSAGDVIPQIKLPDMRNNIRNLPELKIKKVCPYCKEKLTRYGTEYKCKNPDCIRVNTGRITNFLDKLGVDGVSDKTVELLYNENKIKSISDIFNLKVKDIENIEGMGTVSANNIISKIANLKVIPISVSRLFGALGITNISEKKCRKMFETIPLEKLLKSEKPKKLVETLIQADGIGWSTAEVFVEFVFENKDLIKYLVTEMNIVDDADYRAAIVFSGFRDRKWVDKFRSIGIDVIDNVTSKTVAVVSGNMNHNSTKCKRAKEKNIDIYDFKDIDKLYHELKSATDIKL